MSQKEYIPEIIEAVNNEGQDTWYFALINKDKYSEYKTASKQGQVDIKQNDEGALFISINGEKCGRVTDNGVGAPTAEQKDEFVKKYGIPKLKENSKKDTPSNGKPNKKTFD